MPFKGQACWAKMMSPGDKLTALAYHPIKKENSAEELTNLSINLEVPFKGQASWAKMTSPGDKLIAVAYHPIKK